MQTLISLGRVAKAEKCSNLVKKYAARMHNQTSFSKTVRNLKSEVAVLGFFMRIVIPTRS
jgi:hypothetical protein